MQKSTKQGFWYGFNRAALILIIFFLLGLPLLFALADFVRSVDFSVTTSAPAFALTPTTFEVVIDNSKFTPLNAVEFELAYNPEALLITAIVPHDALCEERFIISNTFNNASGTALFQCGTITPFNGKGTTIATVHAIPLTSGTTSISFGELTHVIAHDGLGTDVTQNVTDLVFNTI